MYVCMYVCMCECVCVFYCRTQRNTKLPVYTEATLYIAKCTILYNEVFTIDSIQSSLLNRVYWKKKTHNNVYV